MAVLIRIPKKKVGPLKFGAEEKFKLKLFPFVLSIKETHLFGIGFMSKPIIKVHERWVKVLNENEIYVYKNSLNDCYVCHKFFGKVSTKDINVDPHISKVFSWQP